MLRGLVWALVWRGVAWHGGGGDVDLWHLHTHVVPCLHACCVYTPIGMCTTCWTCASSASVKFQSTHSTSWSRSGSVDACGSETAPLGRPFSLFFCALPSLSGINSFARSRKPKPQLNVSGSLACQQSRNRTYLVRSLPPTKAAIEHIWFLMPLTVTLVRRGDLQCWTRFPDDV
jgi:hypothetical protein